MSESTTPPAPAGETAAEAPAAPEAPPAPVTAPAAPPIPEEPPASEAPARPERRVLRAVGRWTAAVTVFAVLAGGIGYGLTLPDRTDLPGLATQDDGRWDYPKLSLPALPAGSYPITDVRNAGGTHDVDLRKLLLPAPKGAKAGEDLPPVDGGWVPVKDFVSLYAEDNRVDMTQALQDDAVRHIAARGWTMPDGTKTSVYLLQFNTQAYVFDFFTEKVLGGLAMLADAPERKDDNGWIAPVDMQHVQLFAYDETKPYGPSHVRYAAVMAGDVFALVVQERDGKAPPEVPWHQTVVLQSQLLG